MAGQQTFQFDTPQRSELSQGMARRTDPDTSHLAAQSKANQRQSWRNEFLRRLRRLGGPSTANEIAAGNESIRKRAKELVDDGLIQIHDKRTCRRNGTVCQTYWFNGERI